MKKVFTTCVLSFFIFAACIPSSISQHGVPYRGNHAARGAVSPYGAPARSGYGAGPAPHGGQASARAHRNLPVGGYGSLPAPSSYGGHSAGRPYAGHVASESYSSHSTNRVYGNAPAGRLYGAGPGLGAYGGHHAAGPGPSAYGGHHAAGPYGGVPGPRAHGPAAYGSALQGRGYQGGYQGGLGQHGGLQQGLSHQGSPARSYGREMKYTVRDPYSRGTTHVTETHVVSSKQMHGAEAEAAMQKLMGSMIPGGHGGGFNDLVKDIGVPFY